MAWLDITNAWKKKNAKAVPNANLSADAQAALDANRPTSPTEPAVDPRAASRAYNANQPIQNPGSTRMPLIGEMEAPSTGARPSSPGFANQLGIDSMSNYAHKAKVGLMNAGQAISDAPGAVKDFAVDTASAIKNGASNLASGGQKVVGGAGKLAGKAAPWIAPGVEAYQLSQVYNDPNSNWADVGQQAATGAARLTASTGLGIAGGLAGLGVGAPQIGSIAAGAAGYEGVDKVIRGANRLVNGDGRTPYEKMQARNDVNPKAAPVNAIPQNAQMASSGAPAIKTGSSVQPNQNAQAATPSEAQAWSAGNSAQEARNAYANKSNPTQPSSQQYPEAASIRSASKNEASQPSMQSIEAPSASSTMQGRIPASLADRGLPSATEAMTAYGVLNKNDGYTNPGQRNATATFADNGPVRGNEAGIGKNVGAPSPFFTGQQQDPRQERIDSLLGKIDNTTGGSIADSVMRGVGNRKIQAQIDELSKVDSANRAADNATQNTSISDFTSKANAQHGIDSLQVQRENNVRLGDQNAISQARQDYLAQGQMERMQSQADLNNAKANQDPNARYDAQQERDFVKARDNWKPDEHNGMPFPYKDVASHVKGESSYMPVTADHYKALGSNPSEKDLAEFKAIHGIDPVKSDWKKALK